MWIFEEEKNLSFIQKRRVYIQSSATYNEIIHFVLSVKVKEIGLPQAPTKRLFSM